LSIKFVIPPSSSVGKNEKNIFPDDSSAQKAVYLAIANIEKKWTMPILNWGIILNAFLTTFYKRCQFN